MLKKILFLCLLVASIIVLQAQNIRIKGTVKSAQTGSPLSGAAVSVAATSGAYTDDAGAFDIETQNLTPPFEVKIEYIGFVTQTIPVSVLTSEVDLGEIKMAVAVLQGNEVVVIGSRVSETVLQSASSVQKLNIQTIRSTASGDFYEGLGNLKGVDIVTSSLGFRSFNTRGFNTTSPVRVVQFIDGMDNQAPGLNFPVGNLVGATDLDLQSVEVITGPASALYGPNAFQGVISMTTKNAYDFQGLSVQLKGGNRNLIDGQFRYAQAYGKKQKLALKLTGSYSKVTDFPADDSVANLYRPIESEQNLSSIVRQLQYDEDPKTASDFTKLNGYLDFYPQAFPGKLKVLAPGYLEPSLTDYNTKSLKLGGEVSYKLKDSLQLTFAYKYGQGTAVYQATNRYNIKNIQFHQQKLELKGKNFVIRAYNTMENAGDSYDLVFTGVNLSKSYIKNYVSNYLGTYFDTLLYLARGGTTDSTVKPGEPQKWMIERAKAAALAQAPNGAQLQPGSNEFNAEYNSIIKNASLSRGSKFTDISSLQHIEGQYNLPVKWANIISGANVRFYNPQSYGTIFSDTLVNRKDTMPDGSADLSAQFVNLTVWEVGGYVQAQKKFLKDKIHVTASVRADKNQNFQPQFSPRASIVFAPKNHVFRASYQSAFRIPTLQNQFILLTLGQLPVAGEFVDFRLEGNLQGHDNLYSLQSVKDFRGMYDSTFEIKPELLKQVSYSKIRPEYVRTFELGYRYTWNNKLFIDAVGYLNNYQHFIGDIRVVHPKGGTIAGTESGDDAILTGNYELLQIPVNSDQRVSAYGLALGVSYYLGRGITPTINYTYSGIDTSNLVKDDIIPGFNTPKHKIVLGLQGNKIYKGLGFNVNYKYQSNFYWQSPFGQGNVPAFGTLDAQLSYWFEKMHSTLRVGGSNLANKHYRTAYGSPLLGRMGYVSWTFDLDKWK